MKSSTFRSIFLYGALLAMLSLTLAAQMRRGQGKGMPQYDPKTEVTLSGTIEEVKLMPSPGMKGGGTHLVLNTGTETIDVHAGPTWFLKDHNYTFAKGDHIDVTGSKISVGGSDALIAREIKKGSETMTLRDSQGIPAWSRRKG